MKPNPAKPSFEMDWFIYFWKKNYSSHSGSFNEKPRIYDCGYRILKLNLVPCQSRWGRL